MLRDYYHWTHKDNAESISRTGIDPAYSEGRMEVAWVCAARRVGWALCHVAQRHGWDPDDMVCFEVELHDGNVKRTCNDGVYTSASIIDPDAIVAVRVTHRGEFGVVRSLRGDTPKADK